jgi:hypothetical protein
MDAKSDVVTDGFNIEKHLNSYKDIFAFVEEVAYLKKKFHFGLIFTFSTIIFWYG